MGSNPPIRAIPVQVAQPSVHIAKFISGLRPHLAEHAYRGATYFVRSRAAGDTLSEEDWNPHYVPPALDPASLAKLVLQLHAHNARRCRTAAALPGGAASTAAPLAPPARDNTHSVDAQRPKHAPRSRTSPYPKRQVGHKPSLHITAPEHNAANILSQTYGYVPQGASATAAAALSMAQLQLAYAKAAQQHCSASIRQSDTKSALHHLLELGERFNSAGSVAVSGAPVAIKPVAVPPATHAARLTLPYGIFARGVASQPRKVQPQPQKQPQQQQHTPAFDEKRFLGLTLDPLSNDAFGVPVEQRVLGTNRHSPMSPQVTTQQTSPTLESMLSLYGTPRQPAATAAWPTPRLPVPVDGLNFMLDTPVPVPSQWPLTPDTTLVPSYLADAPIGRPPLDSWPEPTPAQATTPSFALPTPPADMHDAVEERAVSAEPPVQSPFLDWQQHRPFSAPPSKAQTPKPAVEAFELDPWPPEPAPLVEPDAPSEWPFLDSGILTDLAWLPSPVSHPEPYTYGYRTELSPSH